MKDTTTKRYAKAMWLCKKNNGKLYDDGDIIVITFDKDIPLADNLELQLLGWTLGKHNCYTYKGYRAGA